MIDERSAVSPWEMLRGLPFPVALAYQRYSSVADRDPARKLKAMSAVGEVCTRYLTIVLTADHLRRGNEPAVPRWLADFPVGKGLLAGKWIEALREVVDLALRRASFMPEAVSTLRDPRTFQLINELNAIRNEWAHPLGSFDLVDDELDGLLRRGKPILTQWLARLGFLMRYPLCLSLRDDLFDRSGTMKKAYYVRRFMGLEREHREVRIQMDEILLDGRPFILNPTADDVLYLWPLMVASDPGDEDIGRLFMFETVLRANFDSAEYVGIGERKTLERSQADVHTSAQWIEGEYARLRETRLSSPALAAVHVPPIDPMIDRTIGAGRAYTLQRRIGSGGMGTVYLATDPDGHEYAVKLLHGGEGAMLRRFEREIATLGKLSQVAGIVSLLDWGSATGVGSEELRFYVMEYAERGDLATYIRSSCMSLKDTNDPFEWDLEPRLDVVERLADAIAALHEAKIVHRDIKPQNVLLMTDGSIRLADLGLIRDLTAGAGLTNIYSAVGTADYMPIEQLIASSDTPITPAADIYAFGVLLFELLFVRRPKAGDLEGPLRREQRALQLLPAPLRNLLMRCMQVDPKQRYADGTELRRAIETAFPSLRRAWLTVQTEPDGAVVLVDGERQLAGKKLELASGVHVLSAVLGDLVCPTRVIRLPPQATMETILRLQRADAIGAQQGSEAPSDVVQRYLARIDTQVVTRSVGYGTVRVLDDKNSYVVWQDLKRDFGTNAVPSLIALLNAAEAELRTKALRLLLHYAVDNPSSVDHGAVQKHIKTEEVPLIMNIWVDYLQRTPEAYWPLLVDLLSNDVKGYLAGVPHILRRLVEKRTDIVDALVRALPAVGNAATRTETVRALAGIHPRATTTLSELALHDESAQVREAAVWSLATSPPNEVFATILQVLRWDVAISVRLAAARALLSVNEKRAREEFENLQSDAGVAAAVTEAMRYKR